MKTIYFTLVFLAFQQLAYSQSLNWAITFGSIGDDQGYIVESDGANNIYSSGRFEGNVDFDPSSSTNFKQSNGNYDLFLTKYSESGDLIWANSFGSGSSVEIGRDIAIDDAANIYLTGVFGRTVDFDPTSSTNNLTSSGRDAFLAKYDSSGALLWVVQFGGSGNEEAWSVSLDNSNNAYVSGFFSDSLTYTKNGNSSSFASSGSADIFNAKIDSSGKIIWIHSIGSSGSDKGISNVVSKDNELYVTGEFSNTVDFDQSSSTSSESSNGSTDIFILKLDTAGSFVWVKSFGGISAETVRELTLTEANKIIAVGSFRNTVDFDPSASTQSYSSNGDEDMFIEVLDRSGNFEWAKQIGGVSRDVMLDVKSDSESNIYTTGIFYNTVDFDPGTGLENLTSQGSADSFIQKLDSSGNFVWVKHFQGNDLVGGIKMELLNFSNIIISGQFSQTASFDTSSTIFNRTSNGNKDIFMLSLNLCDPIIDSINISSCSSISSPSGKFTWTTSGIYFDTLQAISGCDSVIRVDLTVNSISNDTIAILSCDSSFTSPSGNKVWRTSGTYNDTIISSVGCDSILTVNLSFNSASSFFLNQTACDSFIAPSGKIYTTGGLYYDTIPNVVGCDSLLTIFLTLNSSSSSTQTISTCGNYISPSGKTYSSSGIYYDTLQNSVGCDSIITTNLSVTSFNNGVTQNGNQLFVNQNNARYQWLDCNNNYAALPNDTNQSFSTFFSGSYAVEIKTNSCIDTSTCIQLTITSLNSIIRESEHLSVYPIPFNNKINIVSDLETEADILIKNSNGQTVMTRKLRLNQKNTIEVDVTPGIYYVTVISPKIYKVIKLIKY